MIGGRYKYLTNLTESREEDLCYDLIEDPYEQNNIIEDQREICDDLRDRLRDFMASCRESHHGADYSGPFTPVNDFQEITGKWAESDAQ